MVDTIKFSQFLSGGDLSNNKVTVGLGSGVNTQYNNPWTFLAPGTTGDRPAPSAAIYYRLRFNTSLEVYEYYDPTTLTWTQLSGSGTGTVNPGVANDLAFYEVSGQIISPINGANDSVLITGISGIPELSTTLPTGLSIPGATITASTAALLSGTIAAVPSANTDITNKIYVDTLVGGTVLSITGTANQVIASSPTGNVTLSLPQDIATGSTPTFLGLTLTTTPLGISSGGTGRSTLPITAAASTYSAWDVNSNLYANNFLGGFATTVSAAGTTVLTVASASIQEITGVTTQTVQMPVTSTLTTGHSFKIINNSSGNVTLTSSGANTILVMAGNTTAFVTCVLNSGTTAASWNASYVFDNGAGVLSITGTANQVIASASTGAVTLSLPQDIATTSNVTFDRVTFSDTTHGIVGTTTNNSAASGYVGEVFSAAVAPGSAVSLTTTATVNITQLTNLPAGDYDVCGNITITGTASSVAVCIMGISTTSATFPSSDNLAGSAAADVASGGFGSLGSRTLSCSYARISIASTTTVYLLASATFSGGTGTAYGKIIARRRR